MAEIEHELSELQFHVKHRNASGAMLIQWEKARNHAEQVKERLVGSQTSYLARSVFDLRPMSTLATSNRYVCPSQ